MKELRKEIDLIIEKNPECRNSIENCVQEKILFPFSVECQKLAYLLSKNIISYEKYLQLNKEYCERNKYLELFDMAPRTFGQTWGEEHILSIFPEFTKATKENLLGLYPNFDGEFDLWLDGVKIEVKACRANDTKTTNSLSSRAYLHQDAKNNGFKYHYQQLKPSCCDIFIWIGVCRDKLLYWVLTSEELHKTGKLGSQHRNENTGKDGVKVFEGQVFMTEEELAPFAVQEEEILLKVREKAAALIKK